MFSPNRNLFVVAAPRGSLTDRFLRVCIFYTYHHSVCTMLRFCSGLLLLLMRCILFSWTLYVLCTLANAMPSIASAMPAVSWASHSNLWLTITIAMYLLLFMLKQMCGAGIKIITVVCLCAWLLRKVVTATIAERICTTHYTNNRNTTRKKMQNSWWLHPTTETQQEEFAEPTVL